MCFLKVEYLLSTTLKVEVVAKPVILSILASISVMFAIQLVF